MKLSALVPPPGKSKYELAIVAAREARRLNDWIRRSGEILPGKVTAEALKRVIQDEVPYFYEDPMALLAQPENNITEPTLD
jgi:DNA-directed RNA polymerase subunit K/omega